MAESQNETRITELQKLITLTQSDNLSMHHLKVQSGDHHYILLGHTWMNQACDIIHYKENVHSLVGLIDKRIQIAQREQYSEAQFQADIKKGLYIINNAAYPGKSEEIAIAWSRWLERESERRYYRLASNSEHLVTYILTGFSHSRLIVDIIDVLICESNEILLKGNASFLVASLLKDPSEKIKAEMSKKFKSRSWVSRMAGKARKMIQQSSKLDIPINRGNFIEEFCREHGTHPEEILHNDRFLSEISVQFWGLCVKTVGFYFLFSVLLEIFSIRSIIKLWSDKKGGRIPSKVFKREIVKRLTAMLCAIIGSIVGCQLGFRFSASAWKNPYVLGFMLNICSRVFVIIHLARL